MTFKTNMNGYRKRVGKVPAPDMMNGVVCPILWVAQVPNARAKGLMGLAPHADSSTEYMIRIL